MELRTATFEETLETMKEIAKFAETIELLNDIGETLEQLNTQLEKLKGLDSDDEPETIGDLVDRATEEDTFDILGLIVNYVYAYNEEEHGNFGEYVKKVFDAEIEEVVLENE